MEDLRKQQEEALETTYDYMGRLIDAIPKVSHELRGNRMPDTDDYVKTILNGVNFVTEVLNRTLDYINENEELLDKEEINALLADFMSTYSQGPDEAVADAFDRDVTVYLDKYYSAIETVMPELKSA